METEKPEPQNQPIKKQPPITIPKEKHPHTVFH